jgi:hypothetical protein
VTISLSGITVTLPAPVITSVTGSVAGGTVTINTTGTPDLTGATTVTAAYGGAALTDVTVVDADTVTGVMPDDGFALDSSNSITITVDGRTSGGFAATFAPALGSYATLAVDYLNLVMDSKLRELRYALLEAGDQFEHSPRTLPTAAAPTGYAVAMSDTGLLTVTGAEDDPEPLYLDFAIIDALDEVGVYRRSNVSRWTLHTSIPTEAPFITSTSSTGTTVTVNWTYGGTNLTGFQYRVDGGSWTAIGSSPLVLTGLPNSTAYAIDVRAINGTIPGAFDSVSVSTTSGTDTTPGAFTLEDQTGVQVSTQTWSTPIQVQGVSAGTDIAVTLTGDASRVWRYSTDGGQTWSTPTASSGNVRLNYLVQVRLTSSASYSTGISATLTIGGVADTFTITTRADDVRPVVTLSGLPTMTWVLGDEWVDPGATATDNIDGSLPATADSQPDVNVAGVYMLTYTATDAAGNVGSALRQVTVGAYGALAIDSAPTQITRGVAPFTLILSGAAVAPTPGNTTVAYAGTDLPVSSVSGTGPWTVTVSGVPQLAPIQQSYVGYPLLITVGAESVQSANVPFVMGPNAKWADLASVATGPNTIGSDFTQFTLAAGHQVVYLFPGAEGLPLIAATDISTSGVITYAGATPPTAPMQYRVITDDGVLSDLNFISLDFVPPTITLNGLATQSVPQNSAWTDPGATAVDAVDGDLTAQIVVTGTVNTATLGVQTITYSVTDAAGNVATETRRINVISEDAWDNQEIISEQLATDKQSITVFATRDNKNRVAISHNGAAVDLFGFSRFVLSGLGTVDVDTNDVDHAAAIDLSNGGGVIELALGDHADIPGVRRTVLVGYGAAFPDGVVLWAPWLVNANVTMIVANA